MRVGIICKDGYKEVDLNRRKAIHERCLNCSCWIPNKVTNCKFSSCHLFSFRIGQGKQNPKARTKAIRKYCLWCMAGQKSEVGKCVSKTCPLFPYRMKILDRTTEINSETGFAHIEPDFEAKIKNAHKGLSGEVS